LLITGIQSNIIDNLETAVLVLSPEYSVLYINPSAQNLLNASARKIVNHHIADLFVTTDEFLESLAHSIENQNSYTERSISLTILSPMKKIKVDCTFTPFSLDVGNQAVLVEMRRVDRMLRIAREEHRLAQQSAVKNLVRGIAHEVKNPLGGLRGAAQLLERELHSEDLKEYTKIIIGEADRLQQLVDDMLGPNQLLRKSSINIHEILEHVRNLIDVEGHRNLVFDRDYDPSIPEIEADKDRLIQAFLNVVRNAVQALDGEGRISIRTRALRRFTLGNKRYRLVLKVDINDSGPGIPANIIDQIFYPMVTSKASGTGLGLSITQTIVGQHNGLIECVSEPGDTTFTFLLPYCDEDNG